MHYWTQESLKLANQLDYLDRLFKIYPISPNARRLLDHDVRETIHRIYTNTQSKVRTIIKNFAETRNFSS
ncbi:hypothetical protein [Helicobacter suis]|uniref:hypothetical protein n=1 Tax=Helicobacter suis TaxID=104628 RepID=UPI003D31A019